MASQKLSYQALESLWISAGGSKALAPTMAAIAIAESGGRPSALNTKPPDYSVGLWQINYYGALLPGRSKEFGSPSALQASPTAQARAAVAIERQQGLSAWSTYTNGAYKKHLKGANYTGTGTDTSGGTATTANPADFPGGLATGGTGTATAAPASWVNVNDFIKPSQQRALLGGALIVAGGIVTLAGFIILTAYGLKATGVLNQAASAAAVIPGAGGAASKLAGAAVALKTGPTPKKKK